MSKFDLWIMERPVRVVYILVAIYLVSLILSKVPQL